MGDVPASIPLTYAAVVDEICRFTDLPPAEVADRVWREALTPGCNIVAEVPAFGVTAHRFDEAMARLYAQGIGFVFSGLVYWCVPYRQSWSHHAVARIQRYAQRQPPGQPIRILMLGDGTGNDSLLLASHGWQVDYFDVPGSRTFDLACRRFRHHGALDHGVRLVTEYAQVPVGHYDAVFSFEVLEHLPDPVTAIADMARFLKPGGIALVTEAFSGVTAALPTHLAANLRYSGRTPWLFDAAGLRLSWYATAPLFKPYEFTKQEGVSQALWRDQQLVKAWLKARWHAGRQSPTDTAAGRTALPGNLTT